MSLIDISGFLIRIPKSSLPEVNAAIKLSSKVLWELKDARVRMICVAVTCPYKPTKRYYATVAQFLMSVHHKYVPSMADELIALPLDEFIGGDDYK